MHEITLKEYLQGLCQKTKIDWVIKVSPQKRKAPNGYEGKITSIIESETLGQTKVVYKYKVVLLTNTSSEIRKTLSLKLEKAVTKMPFSIAVKIRGKRLFPDELGLYVVQSKEYEDTFDLQNKECKEMILQIIDQMYDNAKINLQEVRKAILVNEEHQKYPLLSPLRQFFHSLIDFWK